MLGNHKGEGVPKIGGLRQGGSQVFFLNSMITFFFQLYIFQHPHFYFYFTYDLNTLYLFFVVLVNLELKMNSQDCFFFQRQIICTISQDMFKQLPCAFSQSILLQARLANCMACVISIVQFKTYEILRLNNNNCQYNLYTRY